MKDKYKVLIVDDEEEILGSLEKLLQQEGYTVETTQNAANAFERVKSDKYHIILIDIGIPEMNGTELLKEIKKYDPMTQIIMMTEHSTIDKILSSLEYGANDYVAKAFQGTEYILNVVEYSVKKLERWREAIIQIVK